MTENVTIADDDIICICGNRPDLDGFDTSDTEGRYVEPSGDWKQTYVCRACGRVVKHDTGKVLTIARPVQLIYNALAQEATLIPEDMPYRKDLIATTTALCAGDRSWVETEYVLGALISRSNAMWVWPKNTTNPLATVASRMGEIRDALWAEYGAEYV